MALCSFSKDMKIKMKTFKISQFTITTIPIHQSAKKYCKLSIPYSFEEEKRKNYQHYFKICRKPT